MLKDRVYNKPTHRNTLEGILYRMRTGCPWRDVPESFGDWSTIDRRFDLWSKKGVLMSFFRVLRYGPDLELSLLMVVLLKHISTVLAPEQRMMRA
jgi:transposase